MDEIIEDRIALIESNSKKYKKLMEHYKKVGNEVKCAKWLLACLQIDEELLFLERLLNDCKKPRV